MAATAILVFSGCSGSDSEADTASESQESKTQESSTTSPKAAEAEARPLDRFAGFESPVYKETGAWLCRPDTDDPCDQDMDSSVVATDGSTEIEEFTPDPAPKIDCFYVYPTISADPGPNSDMEPSEESEYRVVRNQAARLGSVCRLFAPVYRQITLPALGAALGGDAQAMQAAREVAYGDVADAFRQYMANDNEGRPFVLIGHSQGAGILNRLIASEVDPHEDVRQLLLSAYLAGSAVGVPAGADVGGDFQNIALCRSLEETGCVYTWASFRASQPIPEDSLFGRPREGTLTAGCAVPSAPAGGPAELDAYLPSDPMGSILSAGDGSKSWTGAAGPKVTTAFVTVPGLLTGECRSIGAFEVLSVTVNADPSDARADDIGGDLTPQWGLHLADVNLLMGDIITSINAQTAGLE